MASKRKWTKCPGCLQPNISINYDDDVIVEEDAEWFLDFLENSIKNGTKYKQGELIQIGWMIDKLAESMDGSLCINEPDMQHMPIKYIESVNNTLLNLRIQKALNESIGFEDQINFPNILQTAIVCINIDDSEDKVLSREENEGNDSGWFMGCIDERHDHHNPDQLKRVSLYEIGMKHPELIQYLALPSKISMIYRSGTKPEIYYKNMKAIIKRGSYLDMLEKRIKKG